MLYAGHYIGSGNRTCTDLSKHMICKGITHSAYIDNLIIMCCVLLVFILVHVAGKELHK